MEVLVAMGFTQAQIEEAQANLGTEAARDVEAVLELLLNGPDSSAQSLPNPTTPLMTAPPPAAVHTSDSSLGWNANPGGSGVGGTDIQGRVVQLGVSQFDYGAAGSSACTRIAIMAIRALLRRFSEVDVAVIENEEVILMTCLEAIGEGVSLIGASEEHQDVDEVLQLATSIELEKVDFLQSILKTGENAFVDVTQKIQSLLPGDGNGIIGVVLTKPPLTVAIIAYKVVGKDVTYSIFDSHSRPELGMQSAYFCHSLSKAHLDQNLQKLFPRISTEEEELAVELMYHSYEAHFFHLALPINL